MRLAAKRSSVVGLLTLSATLAGARFGGDGTPPNAPTELAVVTAATTTTSVTLSWLAPSEGGGIREGELAAAAPGIDLVPKGETTFPYGGPVAGYQVGISFNEIYDWMWDDDSITVIPGPPSPLDPGGKESFAIPGLQPGRHYHFSVRAIAHDGTPGYTPNDVEETTLRIDTPPSTISDLAVVTVEEDSATLRWTAGVEDGGYNGSGPAASYDLRYWDPTAPGASYATGTPVSMPLPAAPGTVQHVTISDLTIDTTYTMAMRVRDAEGAWSPLSNEVGFVTALPTESTGRKAACGGSASTAPVLVAMLALVVLAARRS